MRLKCKDVERKKLFIIVYAQVIGHMLEVIALFIPPPLSI